MIPSEIIDVLPLRHPPVSLPTPVTAAFRGREIEALCDRILFLHVGRIIMEGPPREITARFGDADLETLFLRVAREGGG